MLPEIDTFYKRLQYAKNTFCPKTPWSDLADATGIDRSNFSRYKKGDYFPSAVTLIKLAHLLGVNAVWLAGEEIDISGAGLDLLTNLFESMDEGRRARLLEYAKQLGREQPPNNT